MQSAEYDDDERIHVFYIRIYTREYIGCVAKPPHNTYDEKSDEFRQVQHGIMDRKHAFETQYYGRNFGESVHCGNVCIIRKIEEVEHEGPI